MTAMFLAITAMPVTTILAQFSPIPGMNMNALNKSVFVEKKKVLDKCTPFAVHKNDNITSSQIGYDGKNETFSCSMEMPNLTNTYCNMGDNYSKVVCNDPRYKNWYEHYWKTKDITVLQIISNTTWSGSYGDSSGSTSTDGQGSRNITLSCDNGDGTGFYSAFFGKKAQNGILILNVIQNITTYYSPPQVVSSHVTNAAYGSVSASGEC